MMAPAVSENRIQYGFSTESPIHSPATRSQDKLVTANRAKRGEEV
jgi:hypothetical protein